MIEFDPEKYAQFRFVMIRNEHWSTPMGWDLVAVMNAQVARSTVDERRIHHDNYAMENFTVPLGVESFPVAVLGLRRDEALADYEDLENRIHALEGELEKSQDAVLQAELEAERFEGKLEAFEKDLAIKQARYDTLAELNRKLEGDIGRLREYFGEKAVKEILA